MPAGLRFRVPYPPSKATTATTTSTSTTVPRTPKSPYGVYAGSPVSPLPTAPKKISRLSQRIILGLLFFTALFSLLVFAYRSSFLPEIPVRSSVYWRTQSALHASREPSSSSFAAPTGQVRAVFTDQYAFQLSGSKGDRAWLGMLPQGEGRVSVTEPRKYGLPSSAPAVDGDGNAIPGKEIFEVSVVKQLECLSFIRLILIDYDREMHPHDYERAHTFHCLDHIRQAVLCASDTTLEPIRSGGSGGGDTAGLGDSRQQHEVVGAKGDSSEVAGRAMDLSPGPGSGFTATLHTCRNWTAVRGWIEENK